MPMARFAPTPFLLVPARAPVPSSATTSGAGCPGPSVPSMPVSSAGHVGHRVVRLPAGGAGPGQFPGDLPGSGEADLGGQLGKIHRDPVGAPLAREPEHEQQRANARPHSRHRRASTPAPGCPPRCAASVSGCVCPAPSATRTRPRRAGIQHSRLDRERQRSSGHGVGDSSQEGMVACSPTRSGPKFNGAPCHRTIPPSGDRTFARVDRTTGRVNRHTHQEESSSSGITEAPDGLFDTWS